MTTQVLIRVLSALTESVNTDLTTLISPGMVQFVRNCLVPLNPYYKKYEWVDVVSQFLLTAAAAHSLALQPIGGVTPPRHGRTGLIG
jgi:hypothetical protein